MRNIYSETNRIGVKCARNYAQNRCKHGTLTRYAKLRVVMRQECRERFPHHRLPSKSIVSDPGMHHDTCVTHVPWCMSGSLTRGGGENVTGIPGAYATRNFTYLVIGPLHEWIEWNKYSQLWMVKKRNQICAFLITLTSLLLRCNQSIWNSMQITSSFVQLYPCFPIGA